MGHLEDLMGFADDQLIPLVDEGLGNSAYLVDLGDGRALAVDASRDLRALRTAAARRGLTVAFAAATHLHADFLSGAVQLAADDGAAVLASATAPSSTPRSPTATRPTWAD
jgi:hydroxyacylglutathione hydrolase